MLSKYHYYNRISQKRSNIKFLIKLDEDNNNKYKVKKIGNSKVYTKKLDSDHLLSLYYLVLQKNYFEKKNNQKYIFAIIYFQRLITIFHKKYLEKLSITFLSFNSALVIAKLTINYGKGPK